MRIDAHRGHRDYPENSLEAVVASFREGADVVEIDAQRLRDGTWVLHHDLTLGRVVNGAGTVGKLSSAQWSSLSMKDRNGRATDIVPPTLDAVVAASKTYFARVQRLNVEFKGYYSCGQIEAAVGGMVAAGASARSLTLMSVDAAAVQCMNRFPKAYRAQILLDPRAATNGLLAQRAASQLSALTSVPQIAAFAARHPAPVGLHVSASMLANDPGLLTRTYGRGVKLFVYATRGRCRDHISAGQRPKRKRTATGRRHHRWTGRTLLRESEASRKLTETVTSAPSGSSESFVTSSGGRPLGRTIFLLWVLRRVENCPHARPPIRAAGRGGPQ